MQNWNDGKLQEYANRTAYDMDKSSLKRPTTSVVTLSNYSGEVSVKVEKPEIVKYLFVTKTCPNCRLAKEYLKDVQYVLGHARVTTALNIYTHVTQNQKNNIKNAVNNLNLE